ncbi:MAG: hypothetical protein CBC24_04160, partial [Candidatus Pelagibacter sp. TMED64]
MTNKVINCGTNLFNFIKFILYDSKKKGLENLALFNSFKINYLDGGTYKIPPLVHNSFGPLSGKI